MEIVDSDELLDARDRYIELLGDLQEIEEKFCNEAEGCYECALNHLCVTIKRF